MLLYIHIPYCDSKCYYCSFNSYTTKHHTKKVYMQRLYKQLEYELDRFEVKRGDIATLFIGGGTPTTVDASMYEDIFELISPYLNKNAEITTEANPNSATKEWLETMKSFGVNRVSFGVQSFDDDKLKKLNRSHTSKDAIRAIQSADSVGIKRISLDIIYNFAGDSTKSISNDIDKASLLPVEHISAYELTIESNTPFEATPYVKQNSTKLARFTADYIQQKGFRQYEISNFGIPSKHNLGYWKLKEYIGVGAGAVGFRGNKRLYTTNSIEEYIKEPTKIETETLSKEDMDLERLFLGLRSKIGFNKEVVPKDKRFLLDILIQEKKLLFKNGKYYNKDYFLADEIALYLSN